MKTLLSWIQLSSLHLVGLVTIAALWSAYYRYKGETERMQAELISFQDFNPVLIIQDVNELAVLEEPSLWQHEKTWQVYVPESGRYELFATEAQEPAETTQLPLSGGRHRITFRNAYPSRQQNGQTVFHRLLFIVDGEETVFWENPIEQLGGQNDGRFMLVTRNITLGDTITHSSSKPLILFEPTQERELQWRLEIRPVIEP